MTEHDEVDDTKPADSPEPEGGAQAQGDGDPGKGSEGAE